eukprot:gnl/Hemi2/7852_TR2709_c0_g1_i1.p1 gnl/Hemi2/7852_TR2709_c0_g1~~gnl/Hemi2/7852_TR2709_c0_g1_i1.p1  ORF type:complete len:298 (-),score=72.64 gnl/Hemi2/7852_TR2709_c0_g1_i1:174-1016(-)
MEVEQQPAASATEEAAAVTSSKSEAMVIDSKQEATEVVEMQPAGGADNSAADVVNFKIHWGKQQLDASLPLTTTLAGLRLHIESRTHIPCSMQKIMFKGILKNEQDTLSKIGLTQGAKVMLIGSALTDILSAAAPPPPSATATSNSDGTPKAEPLCLQTEHKKILDKGLPDDALPGIPGLHEPLPRMIGPLLNKRGEKVRLTFKDATDELWVSTASSTQKIPYVTISSVKSEPIQDREGYHIMVLSLGSTDRSNYFLYYVPAQYVKAIRTALTSRVPGGW